MADQVVQEPIEADQREAGRLAWGIMAGVHLRLLAGETRAQYSPIEVAQMVSDVIDEQIARLKTEHE